ncbi:hypothetical protein ABIB15_001294 [Marisediminicola sp. UYEF4]
MDIRIGDQLEPAGTHIAGVVDEKINGTPRRDRLSDPVHCAGPGEVVDQDLGRSALSCNEPSGFRERGKLTADQQQVTSASTEFEREGPADALAGARDDSASIAEITMIEVHERSPCDCGGMTAAGLSRPPPQCS